MAVTAEAMPGSPIAIFIIRDGKRYQINSRVFGVAPNKIYILPISSGTQIFAFKSTDVVEAIYSSGGRMYKVKSGKGTLANYEGKQVHCITSYVEPEAYNRRDAYRVPVAEELMFKRYAKQDTGSTFYAIMGMNNAKFTTFKGIMKDISEQGIGLVTNEVLNVEDILQFSLLSKFGVVECKCEVIREIANTEGKYHHKYGCRIIESDETILKQFCLDAQRRMVQVSRADRD